jgi:hypothetical protein
MSRKGKSYVRVAPWLLTIVAAIGIARADQTALQPFTADYAVTFRGIDAGTLHMELRREADTGHLVYETRANPSMLARLVVSSNALERSVMEVTPDGIRPLSWHLDDGKTGTKRDGTLRFDWMQQSVSGEIEGKAIELDAVPRVQDRLSIQIEVMRALAQGVEPGTIPLIDDERIKEYSYKKGGTATLDTKLGKLDTVIYESTRPGSSRVSRVWHAPGLGYLPVRAEQIRKGKVETVMTIESREAASR